MRLLGFIFLVLVAIISVACGSGCGVSETHQVSIKPLPRELDFAGEDVPLKWGYVREAIERELLTTSCMHTATTLALRRASRYFTVIEPILKEHGVPDDFKYLCVTESGFNENAFSSASAAGLWQFLSTAAKEYGLEVNNSVDERYHVEKVTHAACRYLVCAHKKFGSWTLAAASYNAGRSGVIRRLDVQGVTDYWDLFLPEETMRYVPRILSFKLLMSEPEEYGFKIHRREKLKPYRSYIEVEVNDSHIVWSEIAARYGTTYRQLRILNNWIRDYEHKNPSKKSYIVKMPTSKLRTFGW